MIGTTRCDNCDVLQAADMGMMRHVRLQVVLRRTIRNAPWPVARIRARFRNTRRGMAAMKAARRGAASPLIGPSEPFNCQNRRSLHLGWIDEPGRIAYKCTLSPAFSGTSGTTGRAG